MPALHCCGKGWAIGSDDFVPWAFAAVIFRGVATSLYPMFIVLSGIYVSTCPPSVLQATYSHNAIGLLINLCIFSVDISILCVSCRGSITQPQRRKLMPAALYCRLVAFVIELLFVIAGTVLAWYPGVLHLAVPPTCPLYAADIILRVVVCVQWFFLAGMTALYLLVFDPLGCCTIGPIATLEEDLAGLVDRIDGVDGLVGAQERRITLRRRCHLGGILCWCCRRRPHMEKTYPHPQHGTYKLCLGRLSALACCSGMCSRKDAIDVKDVARSMSEVFTDTKYVTTDIQAGLVLTTTWQEEHWDVYHKVTREELIEVMTDRQFIGGKGAYHYQPPKELNMGVAKDKEDLFDAEYYFKYAFGAYGSSLLLFSEPYTACCKLASKLSSMGECCKCHCCGSSDSCCNDCDMAAFLVATGLSKDDVAYSSPKDELFKSPFIVAYDHHRRAVVVAVRGTLSVADAFTDLSIGLRKLDIDEPSLKGLETWVHKGVYQSTMAVHKQLIDEGVLRRCFEQHPDYTLVVTGHSLGAAITSVLGVLIHKEYKEKLKCVAFSNPGCVFSYPLAEFSRKFVLTVVLDNEIIPRLNWHSLLLWKHNVVDQIENAAEPKYQVLYTNEIRLGCCPPRRGGRRAESTDAAESTHQEDLQAGEMRSKVRTILSKECAFDKENLGIFSKGVTRSPLSPEAIDVPANGDSDTAHEDKPVPAFPPGRILELVATNCSQQNWCCACCHLCAYSFCSCCRKQYRYKLYRTANEDYCAVKMIGEGYLGCHIPDRMNDALKSLPMTNEHLTI